MNISAEVMEHKRYSFEVFFKRVLINKARNLHKKRKQQQEQEISFSDMPVETIMSFSYEDQYDLSLSSSYVWQGERVKFENKALGEALRLLLPKYREILMLSYFMDCSDAEIAARLAIPISTVGARRRNAIQRLRERMDKTDE